MTIISYATAAGAVLLAFAAGAAFAGNGFHLSWSGEFLAVPVMMNNNIDLDNSDKKDEITYLSAALYISGHLYYRQSAGLHLALRTEQKSGYTLPLKEKVTTYYGAYERDDLFDYVPHLEELYADFQIGSSCRRIKIGLFPIRSDSMTLSNKHENYGMSYIYARDNYTYEFFFGVCDWNNELYVGGGTEAESERRKGKNRSNAYFSYFQGRYENHSQKFLLYTAVLHDVTSPEDRLTFLNRKVKKSTLGMVGFRYGFDTPRTGWRLEAARNFGKDEVEGAADFNHKGYLISGRSSLFWGMFEFYINFIIASGNEWDENEYFSDSFGFDENEAFSFYSPGNMWLFDSRYPTYLGPAAATGSGWGLNYGIGRPGIFNDPHLPSNIILYNLGIESHILNGLEASTDFYYLKSHRSGIGMRDVGGDLKKWETFKLPRTLGSEVDFHLSYRYSSELSFSLMVGYFLPMDYYEAKRDDDDPYGIFPRLNDSGKTDGVCQAELGIRLKMF